ncbi:MAG: hypothetical protein M3Z25_22170 [Actinomycetota bacterium]|nr:hypothetical protein [Actinomycetota bacterium]
MGSAGVWPGWVSPSVDGVHDLLLLASLRFDLLRDRESAGVIEAVSWIVGTSPGPGTGRHEGPDRRETALCELCAAECLIVEGPGEASPPLHEVCAQLGVRYVPPLTGDPGYGLGVWKTLRWALGLTPVAPMRLPLRGSDGRVLGETEIYAGLTGKGMASVEARASAREMAADSARLAKLVRLRASLAPAG